MDRKIDEWLGRLKAKSFGVIMPNGWLGRPFDDLWELDDYTISYEKLILRFGGKFILTVTGKDLQFEVEIVGDSFAKNENLIITSFSKVTLERFHAGRESEVKVYEGKEVRIIGYDMHQR